MGRRSSAFGIAAVVLAVVVASLATIVLRNRAADAGLPGPPECQTDLVLTSDVQFVRSREQRFSLLDDIEGGVVTEIASLDASIFWTFTLRQKLPLDRLGDVIEGVYKPMRDLDTTTTVSEGEGGNITAIKRRVIIGERAWFEAWAPPGRQGAQARYPCAVPTGSVPLPPTEPYVELRQGQLDRSIPLGRNIYVGPGLRFRGNVIERTAIDGTPVTVYDQIQPAGFEWLRVRITLDDRNQVRAAEISDPERGQVYESLTTRPEPGHPPIADPTDQPPITPPL
jgi:hypothetical protein